MKCKICHKELKVVTNMHVRKHGLAIADYMIKYPEEGKVISAKMRECGALSNTDYDKVSDSMKKTFSKMTKEEMKARNANCGKAISKSYQDKMKSKEYREMLSKCRSENSLSFWNNLTEEERFEFVSQRAINVVRNNGTRLESGYMSKWEEGFALWLEDNQIKFKYEPFMVELENGHAYCPDFYLIDYKLIVEIKSSYHIKKDKMRSFDYKEVAINKLGFSFVLLSDESFDKKGNYLSQSAAKLSELEKSNVGQKVQRLMDEDSNPISPTRVPDSLCM